METPLTYVSSVHACYAKQDINQRVKWELAERASERYVYMTRNIFTVKNVLVDNRVDDEG